MAAMERISTDSCSILQERFPEHIHQFSRPNNISKILGRLSSIRTAKVAVMVLFTKPRIQASVNIPNRCSTIGGKLNKLGG